MGCVYAYVILLTFLGPEKKGRSMAATQDRDLAEATGHSNLDEITPVVEARDRNGSSDVAQVEKA